VKTLTAALHKHRHHQTLVAWKQIQVMEISIREILALLAAVTMAAAVIMLSIWLAGLEINNILAAVTSAAAFMFLGLATDSRRMTAALQAMTGIALLVLAWLQNTVSPDYIIVSGAVMAAWVAVVVFRRLQ